VCDCVCSVVPSVDQLSQTKMTSILSQQKMVTESLRIESKAQRLPMSKTVSELFFIDSGILAVIAKGAN